MKILQNPLKPPFPSRIGTHLALMPAGPYGSKPGNPIKPSQQCCRYRQAIGMIIMCKVIWMRSSSPNDFHQLIGTNHHLSDFGCVEKIEPWPIP
jgi:hypothetical protein